MEQSILGMITDYTEQNTFKSGVSQQYRIMKYFRDILNNWFADQKNIKDQRLVYLLYDKEGNLNKDCIKTGTAFDSDKIYTGTTPAVIVSIGDITYSHRPLGSGTNIAFYNNPVQAQFCNFKIKNIPIQISIITQHHDGTVLLAQLIQTFLNINCDSFVQDNNSLSAVDVMSISKPQQLKASQAGNAKDLYIIIYKLIFLTLILIAKQYFLIN